MPRSKSPSQRSVRALKSAIRSKSKSEDLSGKKRSQLVKIAKKLGIIQRSKGRRPKKSRSGRSKSKRSKSSRSSSGRSKRSKSGRSRSGKKKRSKSGRSRSGKKKRSGRSKSSRSGRSKRSKRSKRSRSGKKRKLSSYNRFVKQHMKGGKMNMKQVAKLWKQQKSGK